jgi:GDP-L-fucose synthase
MEKHSKIFVAGHGGMVGSAVYRKLKREHFENLITASSS